MSGQEMLPSGIIPDRCERSMQLYAVERSFFKTINKGEAICREE